MSNPQAAAAPVQPPRRLFLTVVPPIALPVLLASADPTLVATSLPAIGAALGHVRLLPWMVVANLIASTIAAPAYGRLGDMFGRRRVLLASLAVFVAAALLCAAAGNIFLLIGGRILQGFGGGGLMTLCQALIGEHVPRRERGRYQSYFAIFIMAGSFIGPVAGGFLTQRLGWPAVFLAYVPVCVAALALAARLPSAPGSGAQGRFDLAGMVLLAVFVVPLLLAVGRLQRPTPASLPLTLALAALAGGALFILLRQQGRAGAGVLALPLLRQASFWRADGIAACSGASLTAMVTFLPLYFEVLEGASAARSGLLLMPLTVAVSAGSVLTGRLVALTGRTALFPGLGLMVTAATLLAAAALGPQLSAGALSALLAVGGLCQGSAMLTAQVTVQLVASPRQFGVASASVQLSRSLGSAFGAAVAGAVLFGLLTAQDGHATALFLDLVRHGPGGLAALPPPARLLARAEIANAFRGVFLTVAAFSCTIVGLAWTMPTRRV
ncbi:MAG: MFS transporter [Rhodospirillales bacterium]|nr:MFS transporter [Rhodospirillales bacterium]